MARLNRKSLLQFDQRKAQLPRTLIFRRRVDMGLSPLRALDCSGLSGDLLS